MSAVTHDSVLTCPSCGHAQSDKVERLMFDVEHRDDLFPLKEWVLGLDIDGVQKAYPFSILHRAVGNSSSIVDKVGNCAVRIQFDRSHRIARASDDKGHPLPGVMAFCFAWVAFHPNTDVFRAS